MPRTSPLKAKVLGDGERRFRVPNKGGDPPSAGHQASPIPLSGVLSSPVISGLLMMVLLLFSGTDNPTPATTTALRCR